MYDTKIEKTKKLMNRWYWVLIASLIGTIAMIILKLWLFAFVTGSLLSASVMFLMFHYRSLKMYEKLNDQNKNYEGQGYK